MNTSNITNYKPKDFAELLGVSVKTLQRWDRDCLLYTSIELVKKRMHEYHRRQERRTVCRLSVLCTLLFLSLVGTMGMMQSLSLIHI